MKIVVLENSFVYLVESVSRTRTTLVMRGARNVRYWGTSRGLAELATSGPTPKTILDARLTKVVVERRRVHHVIDVKDGLFE